MSLGEQLLWLGHSLTLTLRHGLSLRLRPMLEYMLSLMCVESGSGLGLRLEEVFVFDSKSENRDWACG